MNPDDTPSPVPGPQDRTWSHPSEMGLATRGHSDRRRSSIIATGVVLGGLGLLLSGVLLGASRDRPDAVASEPSARIERSLRTVVVVDRGRRSFLGGVVMDDRGNVVAPGDLSTADEVWVRHGDGSLNQVESVLCHDEAPVSVLITGIDQGSAITTVGETPPPGSEVLVAEVDEHRTVSVDGTIGDAPDAVWFLPRAPRPVLSTAATVSISGTASTEGVQERSEGRVVFDRAGRLVGFAAPEPTAAGEGAESGRAELHPVRDVLAWARELLEEIR